MITSSRFEDGNSRGLRVWKHHGITRMITSSRFEDGNSQGLRGWKHHGITRMITSLDILRFYCRKIRGIEPTTTGFGRRNEKYQRPIRRSPSPTSADPPPPLPPPPPPPPPQLPSRSPPFPLPSFRLNVACLL